ncbi:M23 family metallopeptidase [Kaistia terrae]|uniref:Peptidoglycan DD-metalloendopeptidase family protein n=1 Tax=Kaistia terrae TaxID=537017 RepID=A0ABW0PTJ4_9HYPH|nr:M23 family metallopeptidase [Kaistia terrae]MCX5577076.1 peptidoglycan DD-metalloendopeptidase family protein [Kaistia terrae]
MPEPELAPTRVRGQRSKAKLVVADGERVRAIHIRPRTIAIGGACLLLLSTLYFGATAYLFFRDGLLNAAAERQNAIIASQNVREAREVEASAIHEGQISAYEGKVATLRDEVGKLNAEIETMQKARSKESAGVDEKVRSLLDRQKELEARQKALSKITEAARRAGLDVQIPATNTTKPKPAKGRKAGLDPEVTGSIAPSVAKPDVRLASMALRSSQPMPAVVPKLDPLEDKITRMAADQDAFVGGMMAGVTKRSQKIDAALRKLGRRVPPAPSGVGGPFIPAPAGVVSTPAEFKSDVATLTNQFDRLAKLRQIALALPLKRPLEDADISSGFGTRRDPFLGRLAYHSGIDFRAMSGLPARTVNAGTIVNAGNMGGYGNCVDVDHGNGVVTRYGHLRSIAVKVGERVVAGQKIGQVGSTGRSTGPHLHYEIRIDGKAIDPMIYLKAGQEIGRLL